MSAKPLNWRKPQPFGNDFGNEDKMFVADGIGGKYSIEKETDHFLLWDAFDTFIWTSHATLNAAKAAAEADWQKQFAARALKAEAGQ